MPADMTMQHFLQFVRSGPLEDVKYDTRTRTAILSFLEPTAARNWVRQIRHRTGPEWLRSLCVALRPGTNPLPVELIALIATKSRLSRCLRVGAPSGTTEEDLRKQVERYGAEWCTDYGLNRLGERMMLLYYLTLRDSMNVYRKIRHDQTPLTVNFHYELQDTSALKWVKERILKKDSETLQSVVISGIPEGTTLRQLKIADGMVLDYDSDRVKRSMVIRFADAATAQRFLSTPKYHNIRGMPVEVAPHPFLPSFALSRAVSLGATRTIKLTGIFDFRGLSGERLWEDFRRFGQIFAVELFSEEKSAQIEFRGVYHASLAISYLAHGTEFLYRLNEGKLDSEPFDMEMYTGLSVTYVPDRSSLIGTTRWYTPTPTPSSAGIREYGIRRLPSHKCASDALESKGEDEDVDDIYQGADETPYTSENSVQKYQLLQRRHNDAKNEDGMRLWRLPLRPRYEDATGESDMLRAQRLLKVYRSMKELAGRRKGQTREAEGL